MSLTPVSLGLPALERFCALRGLGSLSPAQVRMHAPDASYLQGAEARCSLWWRSGPTLPGERVGTIGHYAAASPQAAAELLDFACARLREAGCTLAVGPMDGSTWRRYRLLTWRGTEPPFLLEPDNPDDWPAHFEQAGFTPLAQYYSGKCDDLGPYRGDDALSARLGAAGYRLRPVDPNRLPAELGTLWRLACDAFSDNFLYSAISEGEFRQMYEPLMAVLRPELVQIGEYAGTPVSFIFAVPDAMQAARGAPIDTVILKTLGVVRSRQGQGLGNWMVDTLLLHARALGVRRGIVALMHESNASRKLGRGMMHDIRRYTLFARRL